MALSQPVQNGSGDLQRELLTSRYSTAAPLGAAPPGATTAAPKAEEKRPSASQDRFESSADKADGGRAALQNLRDHMKGLADAAEQREAAERVGAEAPKDAVAPRMFPDASMFVPPPASWAPANGAPAGSTVSGTGSTVSGSTDSGSTSGGTGSTGGGLVDRIFGG